MSLDIDKTRASVIKFATAVKSADPAAIAAATTEDILWTIPGSSAISGLTQGHDGASAVAKTLADFGYIITLQDLTFGVDTVAVEIRGTGTHGDKSIDVAVVNVLHFRDGKVSTIDTHFSDIDAADSYFS
jgi:ketosteroid isomerase-like protein